MHGNDDDHDFDEVEADSFAYIVCIPAAEKARTPASIVMGMLEPYATKHRRLGLAPVVRAGAVNLGPGPSGP